MENYSAFEREKKKIINAFERTGNWEEGKKRTAAYNEYAEHSNSAFIYSDEYKWMLYVAIGVLVMAVLVFLMMQGKSKPLEYIFIGVGLILCLISLGAGPVGLIICLVAIAIISWLIEKFTLIIFILLLIVAAGLIGYYLYDKNGEKKSFDSKRYEKMKQAGKNFNEHDRLFKLELVRAMGNLCAQYGATDDEYNAAMNELYAEFKKPHSYEVGQYLFADASQLAYDRPVQTKTASSSAAPVLTSSLRYNRNGYLLMGQHTAPGSNPEDIEWIVLDQKDNKVLAVSRRGLAYGSAKDAEGNLRKIKMTCFLKPEADLIEEIRLLTAEEVEALMREGDRKCAAYPEITDECQMDAEIRMKQSSDYCWWWLAGNSDGKQAYADCAGIVHNENDGIEEDFEYFVIRPSIWVRKA